MEVRTLSVYVCIKKIGVCVCGGGDFFISVAEIRYRHDLVRLCHKFHFCPFQMKVRVLMRKKSCIALAIQGYV